MTYKFPLNLLPLKPHQFPAYSGHSFFSCSKHSPTSGSLHSFFLLSGKLSCLIVTCLIPQYPILKSKVTPLWGHPCHFISGSSPTPSARHFPSLPAFSTMEYFSWTKHFYLVGWLLSLASEFNVNSIKSRILPLSALLCLPWHIAGVCSIKKWGLPPDKVLLFRKGRIKILFQCSWRTW